MKTILHVSLGLMLLAAGAGLSDFVKMFRSGEIDKIYSQEDELPIKPAVQTCAPHTAALITTEPVEESSPVASVAKTETKHKQKEEKQQIISDEELADQKEPAPIINEAEEVDLTPQVAQLDEALDGDSLVAVEEEYDLNVRRFSRAALPKTHTVYKKLSEIGKEQKQNE